MGGASPHGGLKILERVDVLVDLEAFVSQETDDHLGRRRLWFPNDVICADADAGPETDAESAALRERARGLPDQVRLGLALNLLTEEGLPHFHRLIATYLGNDGAWARWNNMWTAEEDRHGCLLRDYVRDARLFQMRALEHRQYLYVEAGFNPEWDNDPYRLMAYTSLQERATQIAHANVGRLCAAQEPTAQRVLANLAGDESRHYLFYRAVFREILARDPDNALISLLKVMPALPMPGHTIEGYGEMAEVMRRNGIYGPRDYQRIVEELLDYWQIGALRQLSGEAAKTQEKLMKLPARLQRIAEFMETKSKSITFRFDFLDNRPIHLAAG